MTLADVAQDLSGIRSRYAYERSSFLCIHGLYVVLISLQRLRKSFPGYNLSLNEKVL